MADDPFAPLRTPEVRAEVERLRRANPRFAVMATLKKDGTVTYTLHREDPRRQGLTV